MWWRWPPWTGVPASRSTPSEVPNSASSASWTASALPDEQHVDPAAADQLGEVRRAAGVDDDRAGDEDDAAAGCPRFTHQRRDAADTGFDPALRRDLVRHEGEVGAVALAELRGDADAFESADDVIAGPDLAQLPAGGAAVGDDDHGVHALPLDLDPLAGRPVHASADWWSNRNRRGRCRRARPRAAARPAPGPGCSRAASGPRRAGAGRRPSAPKP